MRTPQLEKRYGNSLLIGRKTGWERRNDRVAGNLVGLRCDEGLPVSFYQYPNNLGRPLPEHFDIRRRRQIVNCTVRRGLKSWLVRDLFDFRQARGKHRVEGPKERRHLFAA